MEQKNRATLQKGVARVIVSVRLIGGLQYFYKKEQHCKNSIAPPIKRARLIGGLQGAAWKAPARNAFYRRVRHRKNSVAQPIK